MTDLTSYSATELLHLYRQKAVSPVEVTTQVLHRIEELNPLLNAFCLVDRDAALASAYLSEQRYANNAPDGMLDGVPVSVKDLLLTRGWPTLRGSKTVNPDQSWSEDAPSVARLREHNAVLLGKTTTPEFGCKGTCDSPLTGITRNPWDPRMTSGGSSGGAAVAVACGMGPLAIGSDGAGSIRIPSSFCGVFGHKPSFGRVPTWPPMSPFGGTWSTAGPHSRTVSDAALLLNVLSLPDARDWMALPYEARDYRIGLEQGVRGLRIAYSPRLGYVQNLHPEVERHVANAVRVFEDMGAHVDEVDPGFSDPEELMIKLWAGGSAWTFNRLTPAQQAVVDPLYAWQAELGSRMSVLEYHSLVARRVELGTMMRRFHTQYDLLLTPAIAVPPFPVRDAMDLLPDPGSFFAWTPYTHPFNLTQQPAASIPCGLTEAGLPIGLQIVGPMHDDALVLRAARAFESARPWQEPQIAALTS